MCGISGKLSWQQPVNSEVVVDINSKLFHRGPDDGGILSLENIVLGHRRLSIIDLTEAGKQPMSDNTNRYHIVYNGMVYNFRELKQDLIRAGYHFRGTSDTEVVLYSYIYWGIDCLPKFNGMFALAVWDSKEQVLLLARDRFGKKPLYYYRLPDGGIVFASELTALMKDTEVPRKISSAALNCYLSLSYILSPMTMYESVEKLEPAYYILIKNKGKYFTKQRYWNYADLFRLKTNDSIKDAAAKILFLLEQSVKRRMISDVPIGAFLSGGVDSSAVVALMKKYHTGELHTFSMGFDDATYNELPDAKRTSDWIGTIHHAKICEMDGSLSIIHNAIASYDEIFADTSLIPMVEVSKLAAEHVKVVLSGDGGDEIFAGYITYKATEYHHKLRLVPVGFKRFLLSFLNRFFPPQKTKLSFEFKAKQFLYGLLYSGHQAHYLWRCIFTPEERIKILGSDYKDLVYSTDPFLQFKKHYDEVRDLDIFDQHLYVDIKTWLADDILVKLDRATMHSSIEGRCPYLDNDLVAYVASLPYKYKSVPRSQIFPKKHKYILKVAVKELLPISVLKKRKAGFNSPVGKWLQVEGINEFKAFNQFVYSEKLKNAKEA